MAHINPQLPSDGQTAWAGAADAYLLALTSQLNFHDDLIASILANGAGGTGANVVDNGDNTITIMPTGSGAAAPGSPSVGGTTGIAFDTDGTPYINL